MEKRIGEVTHFYTHLCVVVLHLTEPLRLGDQLRRHDVEVRRSPHLTANIRRRSLRPSTPSAHVVAPMTLALTPSRPHT